MNSNRKTRGLLRDLKELLDFCFEVPYASSRSSGFAENSHKKSNCAMSAVISAAVVLLLQVDSGQFSIVTSTIERRRCSILS